MANSESLRPKVGASGEGGFTSFLNLIPSHSSPTRSRSILRHSRKVEIIRWSGGTSPDEETIRKILAEEDLHGYRWSNGPGDVYSAHSHSYNKVIQVVSGSITFGLPAGDEKVTLNLGDRLNLPAGVSHNAVVGPEGVACIEAHR